MLFPFNVRALNAAVLLIRRDLCLPLGTAGFNFFFLSGILGEPAHVVLSPNGSDFVNSIFIVYSTFTIFFHNRRKASERIFCFPKAKFSKCYIFCISLKHHRTNECRETSRGNAVKVLLTPGWAARGPEKGLCNLRYILRALLFLKLGFLLANTSKFSALLLI